MNGDDIPMFLIKKKSGHSHVLTIGREVMETDAPTLRQVNRCIIKS